MNSQKLFAAILMPVSAAAVLLAAQLAAADEYPSRPISLVVGYSPGGGSDMAARLLAGKLSDVLGQPIVIDYKPGASGAIAAVHVAKRSAPDGYTMLMCSQTPVVILPLVRKDVGYSQDDFVLATSFSSIAVSFNVRADSKWKTLDDFVKDARANPGKYSYASYGQLGLAHLAMELFAQKAGIKLTHVPFAGSTKANAALLGGHVDVSTTTGTGGMYEAGSLRILAVASEDRFPALNKIPTLAELGYPGIAMVAQYAICMPKHTPEAIVQKLDNALGQVFAKHGQEMAKAFAVAEQAAIYFPRDKITAKYSADRTRIKLVLDSMQVKPE